MHAYTINKNGKNDGPFTLEQVRAGLADGTFAATDLAWRPGLAAWAPLGQRVAEDCGETPPPMPPAAAPASVTTARSAKPFNWLIPSILSTVFCCWPVGIVAIVFAAKANSKEAAGDTRGADGARDVAKWCTLGTLGLGLLIVPVGMMAALAIPAFKKVRNTAIERSMMNDARQISAAFQQKGAKDDKDTVAVKELHAYVPRLSSGVGFVMIDRVNANGAILLGYEKGEADTVVLKTDGKFALTHAQYERRLSSNAAVSGQTCPDTHTIVFDVMTGRPEE